MEQQNNQNNQTNNTTPAKSTPPASNNNQPPQKQETPQDPNTGYHNLKKQHRIAIDLRLLHYPYRVISKKLQTAGFKATESTVETWFVKGGTCHFAYEGIRTIRVKDLEEQIQHQQRLIQQGTANALLIVNKVLEKAVEKDEITEQEAIAARDMLDRGGVPKQNKTDGSIKVESESMMAMAQAITGVLEGKKPEEKQ
jgi:hypothetical protein